MLLEKEIKKLTKELRLIMHKVKSISVFKNLQSLMMLDLLNKKIADEQKKLGPNPSGLALKHLATLKVIRKRLEDQKQVRA